MIALSGSTAASASDLNLEKRSLPDSDLSDEKYYPSIGSSSHADGQCRPCGWFWKPEGCKNGKDCHHCHLCPEGEIKNRKRAKAIVLTQTCRPCEARYMFCLSSSLSQPQGESELQYPTVAPLLPSIGSDGHETGQCRPCAWLYKPGGCRNGAQCAHCHLCPEGEIKARKKDKVASILRQTLLKTERCFEMIALHEQQQQQQQQQQQLARGLNDVAEIRLETYIESATPPSRGSVLHEAGFCRPCGWFWKPEGCKNGKDCHHCHACPKDAIRMRKRTKALMAILGNLPPLL